MTKNKVIKIEHPDSDATQVAVQCPAETFITITLNINKYISAISVKSFKCEDKQESNCNRTETDGLNDEQIELDPGQELPKHIMYTKRNCN